MVFHKKDFQTCLNKILKKFSYFCSSHILRFIIYKRIYVVIIFFLYFQIKTFENKCLWKMKLIHEFTSLLSLFIRRSLGTNQFVCRDKTVLASYHVCYEKEEKFYFQLVKCTRGGSSNFTDLVKKHYVTRQMSPLRNQDKCRNRMNGMNNCFDCVNISQANPCN